MHWGRSKDDNIYIRRFYKPEIVRAVIELEKKGFECTAPIQFVDIEGKNFHINDENGRKRRRFSGNFEHNYFEVYMRKVKSVEHNKSPEE